MGRSTQGSAPTELGITVDVLARIRSSIGSRPAESGGVLGIAGDGDIVGHFHFDAFSENTPGSYSPNSDELNHLFRTHWNPAGVRLVGIVHSHPSWIPSPTRGDEMYAKRILDAIPDMGHLFLPIVIPAVGQNEFRLLPFIAVRSGGGVRVYEIPLAIYEGAVTDSVVQPTPADTPPTEKPRERVDVSRTFTRVEGAYDLDRLRRSRIIAIGAGGAAQFLEEFARCGVEDFVLVDRDTVSETNLATQQTYRRDIGRAKVTCIGERLVDINPNARVQCVAKFVEDIDDQEFASLIGPLDGEDAPEQVLLCGFTDSFEAQARVNRLALQFGLPSLAAQVYREGRAAELSFTHPDVTPACQRCALRGRYTAHSEGFTNDVTSHGTPIFATGRLNALKGILALALLHHGSDHPRWGGLLTRIGDRSLVQIRMDPDLSASLGLTVFDRVFGGGDTDRILFDDVVWLPQLPDNEDNGFPTCPDCGGTGDLRSAIGTFEDTRPMREEFPR